MYLEHLQKAPLRNIMVVGSAGSGKSTLACKLAQTLKLRLIHADHIYWQPNWVMRSSDEIKSLIVSAIQEDGWVFEGNCSATYPERSAKADTIIWLKMPRWLCLWRAIMRALRNYGNGRPDMAEGCYDRLDLKFLKWVWNYPKNGLPKHLDLFEKTRDTHTQFILHSQAEVDAFVEALSLIQDRPINDISAA